MNVEFVLRFVFGVFAGLSVYRVLAGFVDLSSGTAIEFAAVYFACSIGFSLGYVIAPQLTTRPFFGVRSRIYDATASEVLSVGIGLGFGLMVGALLAFPLSFLPSYAGHFLPVIGSAIMAYFGIVTMLAHKTEMLGTLRLSGLVSDKLPQTESRTLLLDSSAIIDGRIADIAKTGFIGGTLVVPRFVLEEIQHIADSPDVLRRNRGRRGLEVLNTLQKEPSCRVEISDVDVDNAVGVDAKLVRLARNLTCSIVTTDYNLNHVAQIQGIEVLNVNELTNAVKSVVLQGEDMAVQIVQEGKEAGQGVGYLDDGTMIVVENGRAFLHKGVEVTVTKVLQTAAGRMIFARLKSASNGRGHDVVGQ